MTVIRVLGGTFLTAAAALAIAAGTVPGALLVFSLAATLCFALSIVWLVLEILSRPRLVIDQPTTLRRGVVTLRPTSGVPVATTTTSVSVSAFSLYDRLQPNGEGAYVYVSNHPLFGHHNAENVTTRIRYYKGDGDLLWDIHGRWSSSLQDPNPESSIEARAQTIPANGRRHSVDVAWYYPGDQECYAFNDENRFHARDLRYRGLGSSPVYVEVEARGSGCHAKARFVLSLSQQRLLLESEIKESHS